MTVVLHEHDVPDLDKAITVFFRCTGAATPDVVTVIVENLGAWAAWAGIAHGPEVVGGKGGTFVVPDTDNILRRYANLVEPDIVGFIIGFVDGHAETLFGQFQYPREKLPCETDGIGLEVITKAEVTEHFKKGMVTGGVTNILQVVVLATGTDTTLGCCGTGIIPLLPAKEQILKLVHARIGKQQGRIIVGHQRAALDHSVPLALKVF